MFRHRVVHVKYALKPSVGGYLHSRISQIWGVSAITFAGVVTVAGSPSLFAVVLICIVAFLVVRQLWERLYISPEAITWRKIGWSTNYASYPTTQIDHVDLRSV